MVRNLVKFAVLPFMVGLLSLGNFNKNAAKDYSFDASKYSTEGLDLFYDVPFEDEVSTSNGFIYKPLPFIGDHYVGFKEALAFKESQGNYFSVNTFGYLGKYQFGRTTLELIGIHNTNTFLSTPELQEKAFLLNTSRNKWVLRRDIARFKGKYVGGVKITESGILAAAHLAGPGGVKTYLRSGGLNGFSDGFGTSIKSYLKKFSGYDVSFVQPVKNARL